MKGCRTHLTTQQTKMVQEELHEQYLAVAFLLSADHTCYGKLIKDL